jgi:hypothetical protein
MNEIKKTKTENGSPAKEPCSHIGLSGTADEQSAAEYIKSMEKERAAGRIPTPASIKGDPKEIRDALSLLFSEDDVVELRALGDGGVHSGYFNDFDALAKKANAMDAFRDIAGIYVTLNEVNPALLSRRANRVKQRLSRTDATTAAGFPSTLTPSGRAASPRQEQSTPPPSSGPKRLPHGSPKEDSRHRSPLTPATVPTSSTALTFPTTGRPPNSSRHVLPSSTPSSLMRPSTATPRTSTPDASGNYTAPPPARATTPQSGRTGRPASAPPRTDHRSCPHPPSETSPGKFPAPSPRPGNVAARLTWATGSPPTASPSKRKNPGRAARYSPSKRVRSPPHTRTGRLPSSLQTVPSLPDATMHPAAAAASAGRN